MLYRICDFLKDREQCVKYRLELSDWRKVHAGAPQGTRLGPLVFLCLINDACRGSENQHWKYVDDLSILECRKANDTATVQNSADDLQQWSNNNKMKLNPSKCAVMHINFMRASPPCPSVELNGQSLTEVQVMKLLGVYVQNNLKWTCHVNEITKRASMRLHMLQILKGFKLPADDLKIIFCSYVRPSLEYCAPVWHSGIDSSSRNQLRGF